MMKRTGIIISCMMIAVLTLGVVVQIKIGRGIFSAIELFLNIICLIVGIVWLTLNLLDDEGETDESREKGGSSEERKEAP